MHQDLTDQMDLLLGMPVLRARVRGCSPRDPGFYLLEHDRLARLTDRRPVQPLAASLAGESFSRA